jgi:hypothetical protein
MMTKTRGRRWRRRMSKDVHIYILGDNKEYVYV